MTMGNSSTETTCTPSTKTMTSSWNTFKAYCTPPAAMGGGHYPRQRKLSVTSGVKVDPALATTINRSCSNSSKISPSATNNASDATNANARNSTLFSPWIWGSYINRSIGSSSCSIKNKRTSPTCNKMNRDSQQTCSETDFSSSMMRERGTDQQQLEEEEVVLFEADRSDDEDSKRNLTSALSGFVETGDAYWDAILLAALTEAPDEEASNNDDEDQESVFSQSSESVLSDDSSLSCSSLEDEDEEGNQWTNLTKNIHDEATTTSEQPQTPSTSRKQKKATNLSECLWNRDYEGVVARLESNPEEAHQEIDLSLDNDSKGLPLHLAFAMRPLPPLSILELVVNAYPDAATQIESKWGMLPLHFAVNLSNQYGSMDDGESLFQAQAVQLLLTAYPATLNIKEKVQGRTALLLAASSTLQSIDDKIPPASASVLEILLAPETATTTEALWESDLGGDTAYDIAQQASKASMTVCFAGMNWQTNPLLHLLAASRRSTSEIALEKKNAAANNEEGSLTDATTDTVSVSSGSMTTQDDDESTEENQLEALQEETKRSFDDDASFVTARTSPSDEEAMKTLARDGIDNSDAASVVTVLERVVQSQLPVVPPGVVPNAVVPCVPRSMPVDKILVRLQLQVSGLIRPRKTGSLFRLSKTLLAASSRTTNPYYKVELLQPETESAMVLYQSEAQIGQREALYSPIQFVVDANTSTGTMVLRFSVFHKRSSGTKKQDKLIGSHQTSLWDLKASAEDIPLTGRHHQQITGQMRLVAYHKTEPVAGFLRVHV